MRVAITEADSSLGTNLCVRVGESTGSEVVRLGRDAPPAALAHAIESVDTVFVLPTEHGFASSAQADTPIYSVQQALSASRRRVTVVVGVRIQGHPDGGSAASKGDEDRALLRLAASPDTDIRILRFAEIFGKWCRPGPKSAVTTMCQRAANNLHDSDRNPDEVLTLNYVDDVVTELLRIAGMAGAAGTHSTAAPLYTRTVREISQLLRAFAASRSTLQTPEVGVGFVRALYATYVSYLAPDSFSYSVPRYADTRGEFVEMLKTTDSGQFSYFSAPPGVTRGEHYHHTKTEKFLIVRGMARVTFRDLTSGQIYEVTANGGEGRIVETIPGWAHKITNVGADELIVMLWANEVFDRARPDTVAVKVST